jgi:hypothetical protein
MTIQIPEKDFGDRILNILHKKRALFLPNNYSDKNIDVYAVAKKENFWVALLRPKGSFLPKDAVEYESFYDNFKKLKSPD